jgi:hypothetical protein
MSQVVRGILPIISYLLFSPSHVTLSQIVTGHHLHLHSHGLQHLHQWKPSICKLITPSNASKKWHLCDMWPETSTFSKNMSDSISVTEIMSHIFVSQHWCVRVSAPVVVLFLQYCSTSTVVLVLLQTRLMTKNTSVGNSAVSAFRSGHRGDQSHQTAGNWFTKVNLPVVVLCSVA